MYLQSPRSMNFESGVKIFVRRLKMTWLFEVRLMDTAADDTGVVSIFPRYVAMVLPTPISAP
jgi:hypothetical protein